MAEVSSSETSLQHAAKISTFIFMDIESTCLLEDSRKCCITELCMIAVNRMDFEASDGFPRVTNKLTICLDPRKPISATSSHMTGLYNDSLEYQKAFTEKTCHLLNAFVDHLQRPVCVLAHNGNGFDFPLIASELKRISQSLDSSLLCADTLEAFRSLDGLPAQHEPAVGQSPQSNNFSKTTFHQRGTALHYGGTTLHQGGTASPAGINPAQPRKRKAETSVHEGVKGVRKKIYFQDTDKNDTKKSVESNRVPVQEETAKNLAITDQSLTEFSSSLEDSDCLIALDMVEEELKKKDIASGSKTEHGNTTVIGLPGENVSITKSISAACSIANGTGYYVKSSKDASSKITHARKNDLSDSIHSSSNQQCGNGAVCKTFVQHTLTDYVGEGDSVHVHGRTTKTTASVSMSVSGVKAVHEGQMKLEKIGTNVAIPPASFKVVVRSPVKNHILKEKHNAGKIGDTGKTSVVVSHDIDVTTRKALVQKHTETCLPEVQNTSVNIVKHEPPLQHNSEGGIVCRQKIQVAELGNIDSSTGVKVVAGNCRSSQNSPFCVNTECSFPQKDACLVNKTNAEELKSAADLRKSGVIEPVTGPSNFAAKTASESIILQNGPVLVPSAPKLQEPSQFTPDKTAALEQSSCSTLQCHQVQVTPTTPKRQSYKLEEIYFRKFGYRPAHSHRAEDDCISLLKVVRCTPGFLDWVDVNAKAFSSFQSCS